MLLATLRRCLVLDLDAMAISLKFEIYQGDHNYLHPMQNLSSRRLLRLSTLLLSKNLEVRLTVEYGKGRSMVACGDDYSLFLRNVIVCLALDARPGFLLDAEVEDTDDAHRCQSHVFLP
jgi:hypothetical protein